MADQVLKDRAGRPIGRISTASNGVQTIKDAKGRKKGTYDPKSNKTKDAKRSSRRHWESTDEPSVASSRYLLLRPLEVRSKKPSVSPLYSCGLS